MSSISTAATDGAPLLSVFGGKITTYRKLAEHALERLRPFFPEDEHGAGRRPRICPAATCQTPISSSSSAT